MIATSPDRGSKVAFDCAMCQAELPPCICALHRGATRGEEFEAVTMHLLACAECQRLAWDMFVAIGWRDQLSPVIVPPPDVSFLQTHREQSND